VIYSLNPIIYSQTKENSVGRHAYYLGLTFFVNLSELASSCSSPSSCRAASRAACT